MAQEINNLPIGEIDANTVTNLSLAFLGDSVYELVIRNMALLRLNGKAGDLNHITKEYSNAKTQALIAELLMDDLSEEEMHIFKRGRNAKSVSAPKTCSISEYRRATGFEALLGHLYLDGRIDRVTELVQMGIDKYEQRING
ncbi:MAG: ribonuclease III [Lachnospiraceae bacterium]|nr:ribonuclease III [Lachnospiraceae bacterium]MBR6350191.1 ribonuclease III [Lachnospiraceae bacterium]